MLNMELSAVRHATYNKGYTDIPGAVPAHDLINELNDIGQSIGLNFRENFLTDGDFEHMLAQDVLPAIVFTADKLLPLVLKTGGSSVHADEPWDGGDERHILHQDLLPMLYREQGEILVVTPYRLDSTFSASDGRVLNPGQRLWRLFMSEKKDIFFVYVYAITIGLLSLTTPLGVQSIIGLISGGLILEPVIVLISLVILGTLFSGVLQVLQVSIVESIKQRVFAKAAFEFAFRMPRISLPSLRNEYAPELVNRFFDVLTIQKGFSKILTDVLGGIIQILFGLILLAFYHPFFIFFGFFLILLLYLIFRLTGPSGLRSSLQESKYKYKVVQWIEEIARTMATFKLAGHSNLNMTRVDKEVAGYLEKRKAHFKVLVVQYISVVVFKVLITGGLLILGSILVINNQITLGQFVASEIVIITVLLAVEKIILNMDIMYDVLTAVDKIGQVTDIPLENNTGHIVKEPACGTDTTQIQGFAIRIADLQYGYDDTHALRGVSLDIKAGEVVGITGSAGSGKTTLLNVICGLLPDYKGAISYNGFSMHDINLNSLRDNIGDALGTEDIIYGTIEENITMGKARLDAEQMLWALEKVELAEWVAQQPKGLQTELISAGRNLEATVVRKIILARCVVEMPRLIVLDEFFNNLDPLYSRRMIDFLTDPIHGWTLIATTRNPYFLHRCSQVVLLDKGKVNFSGSFTEALQNTNFRNYYGQE